MLTSIVVPTYNNYSQLGDCIQSINDYTRDYDYEIIIVDNGSQPRGYTRPCNNGMRAAGGELICVVNDDCEVTEGWLPPLLEEVEKGSWVFSPYSEGDPGQALGWFLCFSREGYIKTGGFDEQFTLWCGDIDLFKRCNLHGKPPFQIEKSAVVHTHCEEKVTARPEIQNVMQAWQQEDLLKYRKKWGTDANHDKYIHS